MRQLGARILIAVSALVAIWACVPKPGANRVGGKCTLDTDCQTQLCWESNLLDDPTWAAVPGGHCTLVCDVDADCIGQGRCINFGSEGSFCGKACSSANDCRAGYACHYAGFCIPNGVFTCDPTEGDGRCTTSDNKNGGCIRSASGSGTTGFCQQQCGAGANACPNASDGTPQRCLLINTAVDPVTGRFTGDTYKGSYCSTLSVPNPVPDKAECRFTDEGGLGSHFAYGCVFGSECYLEAMQPIGQGFDAIGDNLCHRLCTLGTNTQCAAGDICWDAFGLFGTATPVGFCL